ncbi:MAG: 2-oxoacid:acceptor oxidoreductase family protein [Desulfurococcaceae archaeon]|nr:2-oxoacid:acceptor oxidoreductase family protein [Desulfurococcaceae archaeon]
MVFVVFDDVVEIRFHGRGGQGVVTAANVLVDALLKVGLYGQAIPFFGAERRGAPVVAYARVSKKPIRTRSSIRRPNIVVVLDAKLSELVNVLEGLKPGGTILINSPGKPDIKGGFKVCYVDAVGIALRHNLVLSGWALVNMPIVGALAKILGVPVEAVEESIRERIEGRVGELNAVAAREAFNEVVCVE